MNPTVSLRYADVGPPGQASPVSQAELTGPDSLSGEEHHFTAVTWSDNTTAAVAWMNRIQNSTAISLCQLAVSAVSGGCKEVFQMNERDGWVDYKFRIVFNKYRPSGRFLAVMPSKLKYRYRQLWLVDTQANTRNMLTNTMAEVTEILEWTKDNVVYYINTLPGTIA